MNALHNRMAKEIKTLRKKPPEGVCVWQADGACVTRLCAQVQGPAGTVYEAGVFGLNVDVPERYPFEPPKVTFATRVYHPNIDSSGRICLDILDLPPKGSWRPSLNLVMVLAAVRQLLAEPNPDDPLDQDATEAYLRNRPLFDSAARRMVAEHAAGRGGSNGGASEAAADGTLLGASSSCGNNGDKAGVAPTEGMAASSRVQQDSSGTAAGPSGASGSAVGGSNVASDGGRGDGGDGAHGRVGRPELCSIDDVPASPGGPPRKVARVQ